MRLRHSKFLKKQKNTRLFFQVKQMFINFAASDLLTMCLTLRDQITKEFREYFIE